MNRRPQQRGIAIGPILFVIAILAVLAGAIAAGSGSFNSNSSADKLKADSQALIQQAQSIRIAAQRLLARGVSSSDIMQTSSAHYDTYSTSVSTSVFSPSGGGLEPLRVPRHMSDRLSDDGNNLADRWSLNNGVRILNTGRPVIADFVAAVDVKLDVCRELNFLLHGTRGIWFGDGIGGTSSMTDTCEGTVSGSRDFVCVVDTEGAMTGESGMPPYTGQASACVGRGPAVTNPNYIFYTVIEAN